MELKQLLKDFVLSEESRKQLLLGVTDAPKEFKNIAKVVLAGHFLVKGEGKDIIIYPTCVEFYYHEELEHGIKDLIVYHRNTKTSLKKLFPIGLLHNHESGVDITFEHGNDYRTAVRASMLIREFEIDGKNENRSTMLYEALYQQSSLFDDVSIKWVDGDKKVDVMSYIRKNVPQFDENGKKVKVEGHPRSLCTEDKKYVQDMRKWQFRKKMIMDGDTDMVYISSLLQEECPDFYKRLVGLLQMNNISYNLIQNTNDIWVRDYMPIQIYQDHFVRYCYNPDYLQRSKEDLESVTDVNLACNEVGISCYKIDLVIDGGNVVRAGKYIIMTEKVYAENKSIPTVEVRRRLREMFHGELVMLPWDKEERYGHADGIVRAIDEHTVLLTNYDNYDPDMTKKFEKILGKYFTVKKLCYNVENKNKMDWAYINFLRVGNCIILPGFDIPEDRQAVEQIQHSYPTCKVLQIEARELVNKGGALNCITWNIKK